MCSMSLMDQIATKTTTIMLRSDNASALTANTIAAIRKKMDQRLSTKLTSPVNRLTTQASKAALAKNARATR